MYYIPELLGEVNEIGKLALNRGNEIVEEGALVIRRLGVCELGQELELESIRPCSPQQCVVCRVSNEKRATASFSVPLFLYTACFCIPFLPFVSVYPSLHPFIAAGKTVWYIYTEPAKRLGW
jgi:hypothetical protein